MASAAWPKMAAVGASVPVNRKMPGSTPSSAIRAYTRGPAMMSEKTDVTSAITMITRMPMAAVSPPMACAAAAATSCFPPTASKDGKYTNAALSATYSAVTIRVPIHKARGAFRSASLASPAT